MGLLASAVTESQIIAVVLSFASLLVLMVVGVAGQGQPEPWGSLLDYLSLTSHLQPFARGLIRSIDGCFYNVVGLPVSLLLDLLSEVKSP